ncbi:MAG TPA: Flp pilus assembly protein CpaB [Acidobacteriota bacterium]|jgi:pilus assembly protein CpaB
MMAAILAGLVTYYFNKRLRASNAQHGMTQIVAAANELPAGMPLTTKDVALVDWPSNLPLPGSFTKVEEVLGRPLIHSMGAKEPILKRDVGVEGSGIGLSGRIPEGMRATAVRSNEIVGVAGFLYPGSKVDVLCTYTVPGTSTGPVTQTVLQDVEVLTAGQTVEPDPSGKPQTVNVVTLLLNPEDSQKLQLVSSQGAIQFVLRSGVDRKSVDLRPTRLDGLGGTAPVVVRPTQKIARRTAAPKPPTVYVLEVIQGTKRSEARF